ncbi:MAG: hypothetical protein K0R58_3768 [Ramlibacter sp.]|nr:hypothetical protein [Ramlibacter sp.]
MAGNVGDAAFDSTAMLLFVRADDFDVQVRVRCFGGHFSPSCLGHGRSVDAVGNDR